MIEMKLFASPFPFLICSSRSCGMRQKERAGTDEGERTLLHQLRFHDFYQLGQL